MKLQDRNLSIQMQGADVKLLQSELRQLGFVIDDKEIANAFFGDATGQAVMDFQKKFGLKTTGVVDEETAKRINSEVDALKPPSKEIVTKKVDTKEIDQPDRKKTEQPRTPIPETRKTPPPLPDKPGPPPTPDKTAPPPAQEKIGPSSLKDLAGTLELPPQLLSFLNKNDIKTLADIRNAGSISNLAGLPVPKDSPVVKMLEAHANLEPLSSDTKINATLIEKGYTTLEAVAKTSRLNFLKDTHKELGDFKAAQLQVMARTQIQFLDNLYTQVSVDIANGMAPAIDNSRVQSLFEERCSCTDCEAAVSPLAYLADLLDYALTHITNNESPITLRFLTGTFHQPLGDFPVSCKAAEEPVRQVRICTEVLRSFLGTRRASTQRAAEEQEYRVAAYTSLLARLGTSPQELRLARTADDNERARLAERLGIAPSHLNDLALNPTAITERTLENIFGLFDTTRDPLASRPTPLLQAWQVERLHAVWQSEDWPENWATETRLPLIDPDLIGPDDLRNPVTGNAAFNLWRERSDWIADRLRRFEAARTTAGSNALNGFVEMLHVAGSLTLEMLRELDQQNRRGINITARLAELNLSVEAFSRLLRIARSIDRGLTPDNSDWQDVAFILLHVNKRAQFLTWRRQEQAASITLSPIHFNILETSATSASREAHALPAWRAAWDARRHWLETLQTRINQEKAISQALREAVTRAEEATLTMLRDALVRDIPQPGDLVAKAKWVTDFLLIDAKASGCEMTTRVAQAIETLQSLLFSLRTEQLRDTYPGLELDADDFDSEWQWIGSYAAWRAATFVFLYPENILLPTLRKWQTPAFRKLINDLRNNRRLTPEQACSAANEYSNYLRDVCNLRLEASCKALTELHYGDGCRHRAVGQHTLVYVFARAGEKVYWSAYDPGDESNYSQTFWEEVTGLGNSWKIIAAKVYEVSPGERFIYLFVLLGGAIAKLAVTRYDLDRQKWDTAPTDLELKINDREVANFSVVVKQDNRTDAAPLVAVNLPNRGTFFRALDQKDLSWERNEWIVLAVASDPALPRVAELLAIVETADGSFYSIGRTSDFRLLSQVTTAGAVVRIDAPRIIGVTPFLGAFGWPDSPDITVLSAESGLVTYRIIGLSSISEANVFPTRLGILRTGSVSGRLESDSATTLHLPVQTGDRRIARRTLTRSGSELTLSDGAPLNPLITAPRSEPFYEIPERLSSADLQTRRAIVQSAFEANATRPETLIYFEEAYYFVPTYLALQLQQRGEYIAALDWFRTVYDYSAARTERKIYYGLTLEGSLSSRFRRADEWLLDPLNPHAIAATRRNTYTRFTIISLIRCLLEFADAEFTLDTAESLPRARILYMTALELLDLPELKQNLFRCDDLLRELTININDPQWQRAWTGLIGGLAGINNFTSLNTAVTDVRRAVDSGASPEDRFARAQAVVNSANEQAATLPTIESALSKTNSTRFTAHATLLAQPEVAMGVERVGMLAGQDFLQSVVTTSGVGPSVLETQKIELTWLREKATTRNSGDKKIAMSPVVVLQSARKMSPIYVPRPAQVNFCIPPNPILRALRLHAELNLYKLRNCRNIAGMPRQVDPYAAPTDTVSGLPMIGAGGQLVLPGTSALRPTLYRYGVLIDRAKQLAQLAGQLEASLLSALEKRDAEQYSLLKARQDLSLARAGVRLQDLRVREAEDGVGLAGLQQDRAQIQSDHYRDLLEGGGISALEALSLGLMAGAVIAQAAAAVGFIARAVITLGAEAPQAAQAAAGALQMGSSLASMFASFERRRQEWEFALSLAQQDIRIGAQQVRISEDQLRVVGQERTIASIQTEHAEVVVDFLTNKFTNVELFDWMSNTLEGVYSFFLQQATAVAHLAANQLAFERQQVPPSFIQADYWEAPNDGTTSNGTGARAPDRRGLTGSARLLQDIYQLDQYAFETNSRKLQLTKTISLARLAPAEFQRFTETGVIRFETPLELFDRDFPGHYLRLIKRVRTSLVALVPPSQGIRATLSTTGASRVVIGGDIFQTTLVRRDPESVALSSPRDATGVFDLDPQPEMLLPFEGSGVGAQWELRLPKPANMFDYRTIADVLVTIDYTALDSFDYRRQLVQQLNRERTAHADRPYSFHHQFADQWYDLHNPEQTDTPMMVRFTTTRDDFPSNLTELRIEHVAFYFSRVEGAAFEVHIDRLHFTPHGERSTIGGEATSFDGIISTRRGNASAWIPFQGKAPLGLWEMAFPNTDEIKDRFKNEEIQDILFVITYAGRTPEWPA